ncbi:MAG: IS4 family transposase, partial [Bacteroidota bacterium]
LQRGGGSNNKELNAFFHDTLEGYSPSKSAYTKARKKVFASCYDELNKQVHELINDTATWKGHKVKAIDGSTVQLPKSEECKDQYGSYSTGKDTKDICLARISIITNVLTKVVLSECMTEYNSSEKEQFHLQEDHIEKNDLLLMDSYYGKASILSAIGSREAHFILPLTDQRHLVRRFLKNRSRKDELIEIVFKDANTKEVYRVKGRLLKKKIHGKNCALFTSLTDGQRYSLKDIFSIYEKRWGVEISYLHVKNKLELANWTGTSLLSIQQDFKAKILLYNITCALALELKPKKRKTDKRRKPTKRKRIINFANAITQCRSAIIKLCKKMEIGNIIKHFIKKVIENVEYSRQNQSNPRNHWVGKKYNINQKTA